MCGEDVATIIVGFLVLAATVGITYAALTDEFEIVTHSQCVEFSPKNGQCVAKKYWYSCNLDGDMLFINEDANKVNTYCDNQRNKK